MSINRGKFDRRITIIPVTESLDSYGDSILSDGTAISRWAMKEYEGGSEKTEGSRISPIKTVVWTFDYISGLKERDRIVETISSQEFDIQEIEDLERQRYHRVTCVKRT